MSRPSAWLLIALCLGAATLLPSAAAGRHASDGDAPRRRRHRLVRRRDRRAGRRPRRPHARHGRAPRRPRVRQRDGRRVRPMLHARLGAHHAADPRVAREPRVRERRKRRVGGAVDLRPLRRTGGTRSTSAPGTSSRSTRTARRSGDAALGRASGAGCVATSNATGRHAARSRSGTTPGSAPGSTAPTCGSPPSGASSPRSAPTSC